MPRRLPQMTREILSQLFIEPPMMIPNFHVFFLLLELFMQDRPNSSSWALFASFHVLLDLIHNVTQKNMAASINVLRPREPFPEFGAKICQRSSLRIKIFDNWLHLIVPYRACLKMLGRLFVHFTPCATMYATQNKTWGCATIGSRSAHHVHATGCKRPVTKRRTQHT